MGDTVICARKPGNLHNSEAIMVKLSDGSTVAHVPDPLVHFGSHAGLC